MAPISWACDLPTLFQLQKPLFFIQTGSEVRVTGSFFSNYSLFWYYFLIKKWSGLDPGVTRLYRVEVRSVGASLFMILRHLVNVISDRGQNTRLHLGTGKPDNAENRGPTWQGRCIGIYEGQRNWLSCCYAAYQWPIHESCCVILFFFFCFNDKVCRKDLNDLI